MKQIVKHVLKSVAIISWPSKLCSGTTFAKQMSKRRIFCLRITGKHNRLVPQPRDGVGAVSANMQTAGARPGGGG